MHELPGPNNNNNIIVGRRRCGRPFAWQNVRQNNPTGADTTTNADAQTPPDSLFLHRVGNYYIFRACYLSIGIKHARNFTVTKIKRAAPGYLKTTRPHRKNQCGV